MNNSASNERKVSAPDHPAFFLKPSSCLVGHNEPIRIRSYYGSVHPEPELALVIGREVRDIPAARALDAVFGYTIFDDITATACAPRTGLITTLFIREEQPERDRARRAALVYAGRYKGTDTFARWDRGSSPRRDRELDDLAVRWAARSWRWTALATTTIRWPRW
jgi:2-keto-4-pentenoate hydratase/2-oxohepta-3-ene-1,7-dioic acid hydratase in catechol pathway